VLLYLAIWIVFPAPVEQLLPLAVAAPEVSPLLLVAAFLLGLYAVRDSSRLLTAFVCGVTILLCAVPLAQVPSTQRAFDQATAGIEPATTAGIERVSITRGVVFAEPEGQALTLDLYRPESDKLFPVVIQIYGGAWRSGGPGDDAAFASRLAKDGYLVVSVDYRHAPQSRWPAQIDDVRAALDWVIAHAGENGGDSQHVALLGRSSGAQLALVAAYTEPARIDAVVSFYGPTNLVEGWNEPPSPDPLKIRSILEALFGGQPGDLQRVYEAASPITYVSRRVPPTLLVYGGRDHVVEARFGRELHEKLMAAGATSVYLELPWAEHAFDKVPGVSAWVTRPYIERFLAKYLR
jgi:acetyl esterase/lipase